MTQKPILLVEDNDDDADLTTMAFRDADVANPIVRVRDGVEAIAHLHGGAEQSPPVVVLLDLKLPRVSGIEVLKAIRATDSTKHLPVVILTSSDEDRDRLEAYRHLANSYVRKPVDYDDFVATSRQLGRYWAVTNLPPPGR